LKSAAFQEALGVALKPLAASEKFSAEIESLLERKGYDADVRSQVLEHLRTKRLVDDTRCAELAIKRMRRKGMGDLKIRFQLERRGAPVEVVNSVLQLASAPSVEEVLRKRFPGKIPSLEQAGRFLYSRGFQPDEIESALGALDLNWTKSHTSEI
jgi:SOS response regulatory protein OraA/RecX